MLARRHNASPQRHRSTEESRTRNYFGRQKKP
jgi:hypothetical protein